MLKIKSLLFLCVINCCVVFSSGASSQFEAGVRVLYMMGDVPFTGTIDRVLRERNVLIKSDRARSFVIRHTSKLGMKVDCYGRICERDNVHFIRGGYDTSGKVYEVFNSGHSLVQSQGTGLRIRKNIQIGKSYKCVYSLCKEDVFTLNDESIKILDIFDNGMILTEKNYPGDYEYLHIGEVFEGIDCKVSNENSSCPIRR